MKAPGKIYISILPSKVGEGFVYTTVSKEFPYAKEYICKDAMLEWAKNLKEKWEEPPMSKDSPGCVFMLEQMIDKLNSM